jgi:uncharacterized DUF497 family protein
MVRFEWDEAKAKSNLRKHGVRFEDAMLVEEEDEVIRIISARKAISKERKRYDENRKEASLE